MVKNSPAKIGDERDVSLIPESGRSPGVANSNPLGGPMDSRAWKTAVLRVTESDMTEVT